MQPFNPDESLTKMTREPARNLGDVARYAGVSATTVSRFLNDSEKVKPSTRKRIQEAVDALGFVPNGAARTLASNRSYVVGAIVPTLDHALFSRELSSIEEKLAKRGYSLIVASSNYDPTQEADLIRQMLSRNVDGLVLVGADRSQKTYDLMTGRGLPFVTTWAKSDTMKHPQIGIDEFRAAHDVTNHLLDLGHTKFGSILLHSKNNDRATARLEGIKAALSARGQILPANCVLERPINHLEGQIGIRHLLDQSNAPTAVICGSDVFAIGTLLECKRLNISVPEQLSVVSFDNSELAPLMDPPLTTVDLAVRGIGSRAADYLLNAIGGESTPTRTVLDYQLVVRKSAGVAP